MPTIEQHVRRAAAIFDLVSAHLPLLETLKTTSFYNFRKSLFGASGTQSYRFRELEWLMGLLDTDLIDYTRQKLDLERNLTNPETVDKPKDAQHEQSNNAPQSQTPDSPNPVEKNSTLSKKYQSNWNSRIDANRQLAPREFAEMPATRDALQRRLLDIQSNGSLRKLVFQWLARSTFPGPHGAQPRSEHGKLFAERYEKAYLSAHASDSQVLRALQGMDSAAIKRVNREAQLRTTFFFDAPHRRAIILLLQFSHLPLLAWPA